MFNVRCSLFSSSPNTHAQSESSRRASSGQTCQRRTGGHEKNIRRQRSTGASRPQPEPATRTLTRWSKNKKKWRLMAEFRRWGVQGLPCVCVCVAVCVLLERGQDSWEHETLSVSRCGFFFFLVRLWNMCSPVWYRDNMKRAAPHVLTRWEPTLCSAHVTVT